MVATLLPNTEQTDRRFESDGCDDIEHQLLKIAANARTIQERLDSGAAGKLHDTPADDDVFGDPRVQRWCEVAANGDRDRFRKRIRWAGWNLSRIRMALQSEGDSVSESPEWLDVVRDIVSTARRTERGTTQSDTDDDPVPFQTLLDPMVEVAMGRLSNRLGRSIATSDATPIAPLSRNAVKQIQRNLLNQLGSLCGETLLHEFNQRRPFGLGFLNRIADPAEGDDTAETTTHHYDRFVAERQRDGLLSLFQDYPVLARLTAVLIGNWADATAEFVERLQQDLPTLCHRFALAGGPQQTVVTSLTPSLSDPHNDGRSVIAVEFGCGRRIVYKPRGLSLDLAFNGLLDWCHRRGLSVPLKPVNTASTPSHGWVEFVDWRPCEDEDAAERLYRRAGMLLALTYVLGATDCHLQNLIISGEHPVLSDLETLLYPQVAATSPGSDSFATEDQPDGPSFHDRFSDSVIRTSLLPAWEIGGTVAFDVSGLGSVRGQAMSYRMPHWCDVNTDRMCIRYEQVETDPDENVPRLNDSVLDPADYVEQMVAGFEEVYRLLLEGRDELLADNGPLTPFRDQRVRFVYRNTRVYQMLAASIRKPEHLRDGVAVGIELDAVSRPFLIPDDRPLDWPVLQAELEGLLKLDFPYFAGSSTSTSLIEGLRAPIDGFFHEPSWNRLHDRIERLSDDDRDLQLALIRGSFCARETVAHAVAVSDNRPATAVADAQTSLSRAELVDEARAIAESIGDAAFRSNDGSLHWIGLSYVPELERMQLTPLASRFYDGTSGIALFLAAMDQVSGEATFGDVVRQSLQECRRSLRAPRRRQAAADSRALNIGGATGIGSVLYTLTAIGRLTGDTTLVDDAELAATIITDERIDADVGLDVVCGAAGAILGLLPVHSVTGNPDLLKKATRCGERLLEMRVDTDSGYRAWKTAGSERPLTGFSHGAAGISLALLRLAAAGGDRRFHDAALEGIRFERSRYLPDQRNWRDLRDGAAASECLTGWCHGAPGIGLARLSSLEHLPPDEIQDDIAIAVETTARPVDLSIDQLCCGTAGRMETLLVATERLGDRRWAARAETLASQMVDRAKQAGRYRLYHDQRNHVQSPGFFQGTAGIGYALLRLADANLPCALLWD